MIQVPSGKTLRLMVDRTGNRLLFLPPLSKYKATLDHYGFTFSNAWEYAYKTFDNDIDLVTCARSVVSDLGFKRFDTDPTSAIDEYWSDEP